MSSLLGRVVLVTGATSGIGIDIAKRCIEEGAKVAVAGRNQQRGDEVVASLGEDSIFVSLDVADEASWVDAIKQVVDRFGYLDVLVNNAGVMTPGDVENTSLESFESTFMTNAGGVFLGCKYAIEQMKQQTGRSSALVNVGSVAALKVSAWTMAYAASKAAALALTKSIALSCAENKYPIRCNAVLPGVVMTPMIENLLEVSPDADAMLANLVAGHPLGRLVEGIEVANAVIYFASEQSTGITGTHLAVDCGLTAT